MKQKAQQIRLGKSYNFF